MVHGAGGEPKIMWRESVKALSEADPVLAEIIKRRRGKPPKPHIVGDPFEAVVRTIAHIQLSFPGGAARVRRIIEIFGGKFPTPAQIVEGGRAKLQDAGLTENQARAVVSFAKKIINREINLKALNSLTDQEIIVELSKLDGIKEWTAKMVMMFHFGRPDVLLSTDIALRKAIKVVYNLDEIPSPEDVEKVAQKWKGHSSAASWFIYTEAKLSPGLH